MIRRTLTVLAALALIVGLGCGNSDVQVTGTVNFDGKPVKKGFITFEPDTTKGHKGKGGGAPIVDGTYTSLPGKGVVPGPYVVKIVGYDGVPTKESGEDLPDGKPLFPIYQTTADFSSSSKQDFNIPVQGAQPGGGKPAPPIKDGL